MRYKNRKKGKNYINKVVLKMLTKLSKKHPIIACLLIIAAIITIIVYKDVDTVKGEFRIIDGDTIVLNGEKIRLKGMDAPEMKQTCWDGTKKAIECGKIAKKKLENIIGSNKLECDIKGKGRYGRSLGYCYAGNININKEMVRRGYAVAYVEYDKSFVVDEYMAKKEKLGFWDGRFERPQDWRKKSKQRSKNSNEKSKKQYKGK